MKLKNILHPKIWIGIGVIVYIIALIIAILQATSHMPTGGNEFYIIQSMIENIADYQDEIESWGYQVSALTLEEEPEDGTLRYYYRQHYRPILLLTDTDGGQYYFYYGFDRYISEVSHTAMVQRTSGEYEEELRAVTLELSKRSPYQVPLVENPDGVYDIYVTLDFDAFLVNDGKTTGWGLWSMLYCSNDFVDYMSNGLHPEKADHAIKRRYSAEQLLECYRRAIALQERLIELYYTNAEVSSGVS